MSYYQVSFPVFPLFTGIAVPFTMRRFFFNYGESYLLVSSYFLSWFWKYYLWGVVFLPLVLISFGGGGGPYIQLTELFT